MPEPQRLWRVFPWDERAEDGAPFSARFVPPGQGSGRFDLPATPVLYAAEAPDHAVAEKIQRFRGQDLADYDLTEWQRPISLAELELPAGAAERIADLCDPALLARHAIRPDEIAAHALRTSQAVAARVYELGHSGLRWWSAFRGEWHTVVLFLDRVPIERVAFSTPTPLTTAHPAVRQAADALSIRISR